MVSYGLTPEVFCIPYLDKYIVHAPLKNAILLVNESACDLLARLADGSFTGPDHSNMELLSTLIDLEIVNGSSEEVHEDGDGLFRPQETTLFLTSDCNLRCVYCYADGGNEHREMAWPVAKRAIEFVADNAVAVESDNFGLSFHGGGEPTLAWDTMRRAVDYAQLCARQRNIESQCCIATNGVLSQEQINWIAENIDDVNVSVDGVGDVHDRLRPLKAGGASFPEVLRTIQELSRLDRPFGIRMTATAESAPHAPDAVRFFCENAQPRAIHIEPVFRCGRCATEDVAGPDVETFLEIFRASRDITDEYGVTLYYSGARFPEVTAAFCQATGRSFAVTTEGYVTSCYEVSSLCDPRSETFVYGRFDEAAGDFVIDEAKRRKLSRLTVDNIPFCEDCFCKYHCAGDCPAKRLAAFEGGMPDSASFRCRITQELTRDQIVRALESGSQVTQIVNREYQIARQEAHRE